MCQVDWMQVALMSCCCVLLQALLSLSALQLEPGNGCTSSCATATVCAAKTMPPTAASLPQYHKSTHQACMQRMVSKQHETPVLQVYGLPAFILFKDGAEIAGSKREGAVTKAMLLAYLKQHGVIS